MAKEQHITNLKKETYFSRHCKGNFLNRDEVKVHYKYFFDFCFDDDYDLQQPFE